MTKACIFWDHGDDYQFHFTTDPRAITFASLAADETVTESSRRWPAFGDWDEDVLYVIKDRAVYERSLTIGEIDDYIAYLDGEDIQR